MTAMLFRGIVYVASGLRYFPVLFAIAAGMLMLVRGVLEIWLGGLFRV